MKSINFALSAIILLSGCSVVEQPTAKVAQMALPVAAAPKTGAAPKKSQVKSYAGSYYRGDGLGYNVNLNLKEDGTYTGKWRGCLGLYGTAQGRWTSNGKQILLKPSQETDMMKGHLRTLDIVYQQKKIALLPTTDRKERTKWGIPKFLYFQKQK